MTSELRVYNFLNRTRLGIRGESGRLNRCEDNLEERATGSTEYDGIIAINQVENASIKKDKSYPYLVI